MEVITLLVYSHSNSHERPWLISFYESILHDEIADDIATDRRGSSYHLCVMITSFELVLARHRLRAPGANFAGEIRHVRRNNWFAAWHGRLDQKLLCVLVCLKSALIYELMMASAFSANVQLWIEQLVVLLYIPHCDFLAP